MVEPFALFGCGIGKCSIFLAVAELSFAHKMGVEAIEVFHPQAFVQRGTFGELHTVAWPNAAVGFERGVVEGMPVEGEGHLRNVGIVKQLSDVFHRLFGARNKESAFGVSKVMLYIDNHQMNVRFCVRGIHR